MKHLLVLILATILHMASGQAPIAGFRPPAVPLITMDPYMNVWSTNENLYDAYPNYWSGTDKAMIGQIRIDGEEYMFLGGLSQNTLNQQSVTVWPTRTIYKFIDPLGRVSLTVQFTTPALPMQWDISSRPITYITYNVSSADGQLHYVQLYQDFNSEFVANTWDQEVTWSRFEVSTSQEVLSVMQMGTTSQNVLGRTGDDVGIDWGYAYVAVEKDDSVRTVIEKNGNAENPFAANGTIPDKDSIPPSKVQGVWTVMAVAWDLSVDVSKSVSKFVTFAYDDLYSIEYFGHQFRPYWRRPSMGASIETLLVSAVTDYPTLMQRCEQFDTDLVRALELKGGAEYATLASLAYRQTTAGTKLVWNDQLQTPWVFFKELSSSGEISVMDVMYPGSPFFLYLDPEYLLFSLLPILSYAHNETGAAEYNYTLTWAPHHLGLYPVADIHVDQQENMPMEETANMLIMLAAITQKLGVSSTSAWYPRYWSLLQSWADYLITTLPDPGDQLCTDDFEGKSAHNANLGAKGIVGLGAFAELCRVLGLANDHEYYYSQATGFAAQWMDLANDGNHYRLQYDLPDTWSMKYNLLFERLLGLEIFPPEVVSEEVNYYLNAQINTYGFPLDNRATFTKLDWSAWVAAMTPDRSQQTQIFQILYDWADHTPDLTPLTDWYDTVTGARKGFTARPVVGGLYALLLV